MGGAAKGIPRNWLTAVGAEGRDVVVPMTTPASMVATGDDGEAMATLPSHEKIAAVTASACRECIVIGAGKIGLRAVEWLRVTLSLYD